MTVEQLYLAAKHHLDEQQYGQAAALGEQLIRLRFSGGYEILARSFAGRGEHSLALTVLGQAVREAPTIWSLWAEKGNAHSELGEFEAALQSYQQARNCPGADLEQLELNEAILAYRQGRPAHALERLEAFLKTATEPPLRLAAQTHRLKIMCQQGRLLEALVELGEAQLHDNDNAEVLITLSKVMLERGEPAEAARLAEQSLAIRPSEGGKAALEAALKEA